MTRSWRLGIGSLSLEIFMTTTYPFFTVTQQLALILNIKTQIVDPIRFYWSWNCGWTAKLEAKFGLRPDFLLNGNNLLYLVRVMLKAKAELLRSQCMPGGQKMAGQTVASFLFSNCLRYRILNFLKIECLKIIYWFMMVKALRKQCEEVHSKQ